MLWQWRNGVWILNKVYVIGMGPGAYEQMTVATVEALKGCDVIVGYTVYVDLMKKYFPEKEFMTTPMRKEPDSGIYGMAGLMYEIGEEYPEVEIEVLPGVTAAMGGAAVLGAPLGHDCCLISLSDLLTPWELIEKRLRAAAQADFLIALYNPSSKKRKDYLARACDILLEYKEESIICGIVRNIAREEESMNILTLKELRNTEVDMFSTVYIGNKMTKIIKDKMVTPRGYRYDRK